MLPRNFAFIDLETTGLSFAHDRVIEIGILRIEDNKLVDTYETLVNPQMRISPFIEEITGISKEALENAPVFEDIKNDVLNILDDSVFVAHNVRFDYGFLRGEFRRLNYLFSSKHFCTAKLSRNLFPQFPKHNLDSIMERFSLTCKRRHRAFDDAKVLWDFFQILQKKVDPAQLEQAVKEGMRSPSLPDALSKTMVSDLSEGPGVYIFYGENDVPLYVGKSINIKNRVMSHFSENHTSSREMQISRQVKRIETIQTAGELGALIKESMLVKKLQPIYNRKLRVGYKMIVVKTAIDDKGYRFFYTETVTSLLGEDLGATIGVFSSLRKAKNFLIEVCREYGLCEKLAGLEKAKDACFLYRLGTCKGACIGKEKSLAYNTRASMAIASYKIKSWPFPGPVIITEEDVYSGNKEQFVIDKWCLLGEVNIEATVDLIKKDKIFDKDIYKILVGYFKNPKTEQRIHPLIVPGTMLTHFNL